MSHSATPTIQETTPFVLHRALVGTRSLQYSFICLLTASLCSTAHAQYEYEELFFKYGIFSNTMLLRSQPTIAEFREEIARADIVIRGRIEKVLRQADGPYGDQDVLITVARTYKGKLEYDPPCVRIEAYNGGIGDRYVPGLGELPGEGSDVLLPISIIHPRVGSRPPHGQAVHYVAPFFYTIDAEQRLDTLWRLPPEWKERNTLSHVEKLIQQVQEHVQPRPRFKTAEVLMEDNFDDGSVAGWTFLQGSQTQRLTAPLAGDSLTRSMVYRYGAESWAAPHFLLEGFQRGLPQSVQIPQDSRTGLFRRPCRDGTLIEFGAIDGRLRLRGASLYRQHLTAVAGDPSWTDYQLDVDMWTFTDPTRPRPNYLKFGPYGRVQVPHFPETRGEHSFIAAEVGTYGNYDVAEGLSVAGQAMQLRCKYPEPPFISRERSRLLHLTKILQWQPWPVKDNEPLHVTIRFFQRYVEAEVNGQKLLQSWIPQDHPGAHRGRVGLWTFETWAEFDNFKVTRLVAAP